MPHGLGSNMEPAVGHVLAVTAGMMLLLVLGWLEGSRRALRRERRLLERLLDRDPLAAAETFSQRLEESTLRLEQALWPFTGKLEVLSELLQSSAGTFSQRLEHSSHNLLQTVEGMRGAATDLCQGAAGIGGCYARLEEMYRRFEPLAAQVAGSQARQQERLEQVAAGLHGITQSLTTVVAGANASQATIVDVAGSMTRAMELLQEAASRLEASVDRVVTTWEANPRGAAAVGDGVTLRGLVEQQQQFINVLDHRLAGLDRYSSSSSSSSSRSSSSSSSSTPKVPPPRTLSNQAM